MVKTKLMLALAVASLTAGQCLAWGKKGHDVTACIAEHHLTAKAKACVTAALDGRSMVYWANWLDDASNNIAGYEHTKSWHYKDVDEGKTPDTQTPAKDGDVVRAINEQAARLRTHSLSHEEEAMALKMIIHFVGDMHQPMHMGHVTDLGGNQWKVKYFGRETNLHSVWDTNLIDGVHNWSYSEWQQQIDLCSPAEVDSISAGTPDDWSHQTFKLATMVYESTPQGSNISYAYLVKMRPVIEQQLVTGGLRLAALLNSIYDPSGK